MKNQQQARAIAKELVASIFKNDYGEPFMLTDGQADIFLTIFLKRHNRVEIITSTQYGKSDVISMAVLMRVYTYKEPFAIIAGQKEKAQIIMSRVIQHTFDNAMFIAELELDANERLDRIKRERSKDHLTFKSGGSIRTFTANTTNKGRVTEALTGFGSPNIIEDEASLIPDDAQAMILRMLGGHKNNFLLKIGNPFYRNHFYKTSVNPKYYNIKIDYKQALAEGRYTQTFIDEMINEPFFGVLYGCQFPDLSEQNINGYTSLLPKGLLQASLIDKNIYNSSGEDLVLGVDVAKGGANQTVYVLRDIRNNIAWVLEKNNIKDLTAQHRKIKEYKLQYNIPDWQVVVDGVGIGAGLVDMLIADDVFVQNAIEGASPDDNRYLNLKAERYWRLRTWLIDGGKLINDEGFLELNHILYKISENSKVKIEPKADLIKRGISSPDTADALMLTFINTATIITTADIQL
jgi:hypothetical protein